MTNMREWFGSGKPWIWLNAGAISVSLIMVFGLLGLIMVRGLGFFWPADVVELEYKDKDGRITTVIGELWDEGEVDSQTLRDLGFEVSDDVLHLTRRLVKVGNREFGSDFQWVVDTGVASEKRPEHLVVLERREWGNFYGELLEVREQGQVVARGPDAWRELQGRLDRARELSAEYQDILKSEVGAVNYAIERLRLRERRHEIDGTLTPEVQAAIEAERQEENANYQAMQGRMQEITRDLARDSLLARISTGREVEVKLANVVNAWRPNEMNVFQKSWHYLSNIWEFVSGEPREANTEGGIFPAIFGTVMMVLIMAVMVTPLGVVAALYLREYAKQGPLTRTIRIAVNNLAGVPSIVYGVFGLGFFVYFLGGNIDALFFPESQPAPTFGTPGILWSSLTLAILTLPVVIVATEEGLARIPRSIREGSMALGATKFETLWLTVVPMASPAIMTGLILAIARAAGEVAPLMLVGVVKLAPSLPMDANAPFIHLERKFMHLGFHIYDVGFQSPNVEAARPLVYATSLLLVVVIMALNLTAIHIRNHLREKYRALES